jgi:hypothetical protein
VKDLFVWVQSSDHIFKTIFLGLQSLDEKMELCNLSIKLIYVWLLLVYVSLLLVYLGVEITYLLVHMTELFFHVAVLSNNCIGQGLN